MKVLYTKISAFRKKEFSVRTSIVKDNNGKRLVVKEAIYECGIPHLHGICENQRKIAAHYQHCDVAKSWMENDKLYSEFVEGLSLTSLYAECMKEQNKEEFYNVFERHIEIACGAGTCAFEPSPDFLRYFGNSSVPDNTPALKRVNFEATVGNIIFRNGDIQKPCFIDYEWVFDFPVPIALVKYHLISTLYFSFCRLDAFITLNEFIQHIFQENERQWLWNLYSHFLTSISNDGLYSHTKPAISFSEKLTELEGNITWHQDYLKRQQAHIEYQDARIVEIDKSLTWHQDYLKRQQAHIEYQDARLAESDKSLTWHQDYLKQQQAHIEYQDARIVEIDKSLTWHQDYLKRQQAHIESQDARLAEQNIRIDELKKENESLNNNYMVSMRIISDIENSFWWKIGAVFRGKNRLTHDPTQ
jgi:hypothetical protein